MNDALDHAIAQAAASIAVSSAHRINNTLMSMLGFATLSLAHASTTEAAWEIVSRGTLDLADETARLLALGAIVAPRVSDIPVDATLRGLESVVRTVLGRHLGLALDLDFPTAVVRGDLAQFVRVVLDLAILASTDAGDASLFTLKTRPLSGTDPYGRSRYRPQLCLNVDRDGSSRLGAALRGGRRDRPWVHSDERMLAESVTAAGGQLLWHPPQGTTAVRVAFPLLAADELVASRPSPHLTRRRCRILVVDDADSIRQTLAEYLTGIGHEVHAFSSGEEALAGLAGGAAIDVLVADVAVPGIDGLELAAHARRSWPGLPIILASAGWRAGQEPIRRGNVSFLAKPFTLDSLADLVDELAPTLPL